jgi:signal transduction histidine kinase
MDIRVRFISMTSGLFILFSVLLVLVLGSVVSSTIVGSAQEHAFSQTMDTRDALSTVSMDRYDKVLPIFFGDGGYRQQDFLFSVILDSKGSMVYSISQSNGQPELLMPSSQPAGGALCYDADYEGLRAYVVCLALNGSEGTFLYMGYSLEGAYQDARYARLVILAAISALCAVFIALSYHMGRGVWSRIQDLCHATQSVAKGDLACRLPISGNDELSRVMESFNDMAERRMADERRLTGLNARLVARNKELDEVAYGLYHDSQTPLSTIGGYLTVLEDAVAANDPVAIERSVSTIRDAARTLSDTHRELGNRIRHRGIGDAVKSDTLNTDADLG